MEAEDERGYFYPPLLTRIKSILIDGLFMIVLLLLFGEILGNHEDTAGWVRALILFGIFGVYEPVCTSLGCTLGQYLMGIRVRRYEDETRRLNIFRSIIRFLAKSLLGVISFVIIHFNNESRAIHDLIAGSVMIEKE